MSRFGLHVLKSGAGVLTSRVFGFVRDIAVAGVFGASAMTDAFFVAFAIPNLFRAFFAEGALASAFVPFMSDRMETGGMNDAQRYMSDLLLVVTMILFVLVVVISVFAGGVVYAFMPGYGDAPGVLEAAASMLRVVMPYLVFVTICGLLSGYLYLHNSYFVSYSSTALMNVVMIAACAIAAFSDRNIMWLAWGVFWGGVAQFVYVFSYARIKGYRFRLSRGIDPDVKRTFHLIVPSLAGVGISQMNFTVGRILASFLSRGSISYLYYANRLFQFPLGIFSVAVATVSLSELSQAASRGDETAQKRIIDRAIVTIFLIILPATAGLIILATPIVDIVYARREFIERDVVGTVSALVMYSAGLIFFSLVSVFTRVYHSRKDMKTPVKAAAAAFVVNLVGNILLMRIMGHAGIALASSIAALVNAFMLYRMLGTYTFDYTGFLRELVVIFTATIAMSAAIHFLNGIGLNVLLNIVAGGACYFFVLLALKFPLKEYAR